MTPQAWASVFLASAALGGGLLAFRQQAEIAQLRGQTEALAIAARTARATTASARPSPATQPAAGATLSEAERLDLLRLRAEATRLRELVRSRSGIRAENQKLKADLQSSSQAGTGPGTPPGYMRRREARFAGYGSPEATLQSLLWAVEQQDTNVLFAAFDPEHTQGMYESLSREGAAEFWKETRIIPGFRIVATEQVGDDEVNLKVEFVPGDASSMRLKRIGSEWKLLR